MKFQPLSLISCASQALLRKYQEKMPTDDDIAQIKMLCVRGLVPPQFVEDLRSKVCIMMPQVCSTYLPCTALIAYHGLMGTQRDLDIGCGKEKCGDLRKLPRAHLIALLEHITGSLTLNNIRGDINFILTRTRCSECLFLKNMRIKKSQTGTILEAMRNRVKEFQFHHVNFECIQIITNYDGKGKCSAIHIDFHEEKTIKTLLKWAINVDWHYLALRIGGVENGVCVMAFFRGDIGG